MKNEYLKNLNKIEFVVTYACTGRCKHCSEGEHSRLGESIDPTVAAEAVKKVVAKYRIKTVMTFGGEPLLYPEAVYAVMSAAKEAGVERRQVITNGYFTKDGGETVRVAERIASCGVNDLLISVDAFHQETIPIDAVKRFAKEARGRGVAVRLQPAWLVSADHENIYNKRTREILNDFDGFAVGEGNIIFPEGNALKYLSEYFTDSLPKNPYVEDPTDIRCLSVSPNGDLLDGNIYKQDIMEIIKNYKG